MFELCEEDERCQNRGQFTVNSVLIFLCTMKAVSINISADGHCQGLPSSDFKPVRCSGTISLKGIDFGSKTAP